MTRRQLAVSVMAAVAGLVATAFLFPAFDISPEWNLRLSKAEAIDRARPVAGRFAPVDSWPAQAIVVNVRDYETLREASPATPVPPELKPIAIRVAFANPAGGESVRVQLTSDGRPTAILHRGGTSRATPAMTSTEGRRIATDAMREFVPTLEKYRFASERDLGAEGWHYRWEASRPDAPGVTLTAECRVAGGRVREVRKGHSISDELSNRIDQNVVQEVFAITFFMASALLAIIGYLVGSVSRRVPQHLVLIFVIVATLMVTGAILPIDFPVSEQFNNAGSPSARVVRFPILGRAEDIFTVLFAAVGVGLAFGAAHAGSRERGWKTLDSIELLLRGRFNALVGGSIATGLLFAPLVFVAEYIPRALGIARPVTHLSTNAEPLYGLFFAPPPEMAIAALVIIVLGLWPPYIERIVRRRAVAHVVAIALVVGVFSMSPTPSPVASLITATTVAVILAELWRRVDLLSAIFAMIGSVWLEKTMAMIVQPSPVIERSGWGSAIVLGGLTSAALLLAFRGSRAEVAMWNPKVVRAERERMESEFELAREAQQRMLPHAPPHVPGLTTSSVCVPARQVGGDMYDFLPLPGDRLGVAVADVTGKGVAAALYMTITKGLLQAAAESSVEPLGTLAAVNEGLLSLKARNVFVTMFYGVLDVKTRTFDFVRAGHNVALFRRAAGGTVEILSSSGIALGMSRRFAESSSASRVMIASGDLLFIFSDGLTEAMNLSNEEFGEQRLMELISSIGRESAEEARDRIMKEIAEFVGERPAHDDMTLVVMRGE